MSVGTIDNIEELIDYLGVPARRIRLHPPPGTATEDNVLRVQPWCELIDGILVERALGWYESRLGALLIHYIEDFLELHDLGFVLGANGMMRLQIGQGSYSRCRLLFVGPIPRSRPTLGENPKRRAGPAGRNLERRQYQKRDGS